jgi:hypothetical protein
VRYENGCKWRQPSLVAALHHSAVGLIQIFLCLFRLRNIGVETSDIESEDERRSQKRVKRKKTTKTAKKKKPKKKKKFKVNPFASSNSVPASPLHAQPQDRFASGSNELKLNRPHHSPPTTTKMSCYRGGDNALGLPPQRGYSPTPMRHSLGFTSDSEPESPQCARARHLKKSLLRPGNPRNLGDETGGSPSQKQYRRRLSSAVGALAKQPVKLAKQPVRLAKYTTKKVRKGVDRVRRSGRDSSDDELDFGFPGPPVYRPSTLSSDDEDIIPGLTTEVDFNDSFCNNPLPAVPRRHRDSYRQDNRYSCDRERTTSSTIPTSPPTGSKRGRRTSLSHVTNAIGVLAMQPVRLAKQPVRLAKYTTKKVRKRVVRARNNKSSDDDDEDSLDGVHPSLSTFPPPLPPAPPVYGLQYYSEDDDHDNDISLAAGPSTTLPSRETSDQQILGMESGDDEIENSDLEEFQTSIQTALRERTQRRSSLQHMTSAIGTVAKQPYKLAKYTAKQPIKLAKYTGKNIRKRMNKKKKQDDDSIVSDPGELVTSEDDTSLDLHDTIESLEESSPKTERAAMLYPAAQRMLSPILDVSEHHSSADLSTRLNGILPGSTVDNATVDMSDIMIDDSDLEDDLDNDSEDEQDIIEVEVGFADMNESEENESPVLVENESPVLVPYQNGALRPSTPPRRLSMTGDVVVSYDPLDDLVADVDQEDMEYLQEMQSPLVGGASSTYYQMEKNDASQFDFETKIPTRMFLANPQDMNESDALR